LGIVPYAYSVSVLISHGKSPGVLRRDGRGRGGGLVLLHHREGEESRDGPEDATDETPPIALLCMYTHSYSCSFFKENKLKPVAIISVVSF
jgi:hypothetical protein